MSHEEMERMWQSMQTTSQNTTTHDLLAQFAQNKDMSDFLNQPMEDFLQQMTGQGTDEDLARAAEAFKDLENWVNVMQQNDMQNENQQGITPEAVRAVKPPLTHSPTLPHLPHHPLIPSPLSVITPGLE
eukprot:TRINITY_DN1377_c0_g1_i7.p2 TRINITY_DN1377_c0_g1~~TRINITY_DN1377_c0_g1_i7.p2  ORF type:complete len:129 (+),score=34.17 TRINITY_DN1377_c0_g1_i7:421-807(+)